MKLSLLTSPNMDFSSVTCPVATLTPDPGVQCEVALAELHKSNLTQANVEYLSVQLTGLHAELDSLQRALALEHRRKPTDIV